MPKHSLEPPFFQISEAIGRIIPDLRNISADLKTRQPDEFGKLPMAKYLKERSDYYRTRGADEMLKGGFIVEAEDAIRALESIMRRLSWTEDITEKQPHDSILFKGIKP